MVRHTFRLLLGKLTRTRKRRVLLAGVTCLIAILAVSTAGFHLLESHKNLSVMDCLWLSYVTMTTVGYGDVYPSSFGGRLFAMVVTMTGGIGVVAYVAMLLATTVIESENKRIKGRLPVTVEGHILIFNCPNEDKILTIVKELRKDKHYREVPIVLISVHLEELPPQFVDLEHFYFVRGNPLLHRVLEQANAAHATKAIILARDAKDPISDGVTIQIALTLENIHRMRGSDIFTVAEALSKDSIGPLKAAGVEDVICFETMIPPILVQSVLSPQVAEVRSVLSSHEMAGQLHVEEVSHLEGRSYGDLRSACMEFPDLKMVPMAIIRDGAPMVNPAGDTRIKSGDKLVYIANEYVHLDRCLRQETPASSGRGSRGAGDPSARWQKYGDVYGAVALRG